jgi:hypothetical protein
MVKSLFKRVVMVAVLLTIALPVQFVRAASLNSSIDTLIDNVNGADSVDFLASADITIVNDSLDAPISGHVDVHGIADGAGTGTFDAHVWGTGEDGTFTKTGASIIVTSSAVYFSQDGYDWYFVKRDSSRLPSASDALESKEAMQSLLKDLFAAGVIDYHFDTLEFISKKATMRYSYTINNDRLVDYLVDQDLIPSDKAGEVRSALSKNVTIGGSFWVDAVNMIPVMLTFNVNVDTSATSYVHVSTSVLFNSFNQPVTATAPKNAQDIADLQLSATNQAAMANLSSALTKVDSDGDGLSDVDEEMVWNTDAFNADTDGDGYNDGLEVANGYSPLGVGKM